MYGITPSINKETILQHIKEEEIYERYLYKPQFGVKFHNPFRIDNRPTCDFFIGDNGRLLFIDRAGHFFGDCFAVAQKYYSSIGVKLTYQQTLEQVAKDFNLETINIIHTIPLVKENKKIRVKRQEFTKEDLDYWNKYYISIETLNKFNVFSANMVWINDKIIYGYSLKDPGYIYHLGDYDYKIYFPFRTEYKFFYNTTKLQGFGQLPLEGEFLIITKSLKDVMVLSLFNIPAIAPQTETTLISREIFLELKSRFKNIYSNFDFDRTGLRTSFKMFYQYNIPMLILTNGKYNTINYGAKDVSDYILKFGKEKTLELIKETYNKII